MIDFISTNCRESFISLMIISVLIVVMAVNRNEDIPASGLFKLGTGLILFVTVIDTFEIYLASRTGTVSELADVVRLRTVCSALIYILRPLIIMTEVLIMLPDKKLRPLCLVPAALNAMYFSTAFFGIKYAFSISEYNTWSSDGHNIPVYITQFVYLFMLVMFSFYYFKYKHYKQSAIILAICTQSLVLALLEYFNILTGCVNPITALCILEYYIYLALINRQEIKNKLIQKELDYAKSELMTLRNQIQPHFIYNSLSIIRSLARRDSELAVECLDSFSDYLKAHIGAIRSPDMIPFSDEIKNVKIYLSLVQIDYENRLDIKYELDKTDFLIPPLSLEPIVENAVEHGIGSGGGVITIKSYEQNGNIYILITDNATADKQGSSAGGHNGIGLENTRKRLQMQCGGSLELSIKDSGAEAMIILPEKAGLTI